MVTYTGERIGKFDSSGTLNWRGAIYFATESNGKLSSLNNQVGVFEAQVDAEGIFLTKHVNEKTPESYTMSSAPLQTRSLNTMALDVQSNCELLEMQCWRTPSYIYHNDIGILYSYTC